MELASTTTSVNFGFLISSILTDSSTGTKLSRTTLPKWLGFSWEGSICSDYLGV